MKRIANQLFWAMVLSAGSLGYSTQGAQAETYVRVIKSGMPVSTTTYYTTGPRVEERIVNRPIIVEPSTVLMAPERTVYVAPRRTVYLTPKRTILVTPRPMLEEQVVEHPVIYRQTTQRLVRVGGTM